MTRQRWIYPSDGSDPFEITKDRVYEPMARDSGALWNPDRGYEHLPPEAGVPINSRTKHREYMQSRGLTTMDDFSDQWKRQEGERDLYRTGKGGGAVTKHDIAKAIAQLER